MNQHPTKEWNTPASRLSEDEQSTITNNRSHSSSLTSISSPEEDRVCMPNDLSTDESMIDFNSKYNQCKDHQIIPNDDIILFCEMIEQIESNARCRHVFTRGANRGKICGGLSLKHGYCRRCLTNVGVRNKLGIP